MNAELRVGQLEQGKSEQTIYRIISCTLVYDQKILVVFCSFEPLRDLSQIYMGGRPETTKLSHFNATNFI